jgi:SOS-response transcriptional repressor LexA
MDLERLSKEELIQIIKELQSYILENEKIDKQIEEMEKEKEELSSEIIKKLMEELETKEIITDSLIEKVKQKDIQVLHLEDICSIFNWEEQKGRKFLKMALQMKYAAKIGKQTIITKSEFEKYLEFLKGKDVII